MLNFTTFLYTKISHSFHSPKKSIKNNIFFMLFCQVTLSFLVSESVHVFIKMVLINTLWFFRIFKVYRTSML